MKNIRLFTLATIAAWAMACSSNGDNMLVTPQDKALKGDLKDYYLVVDKEYPIVKDGGAFTNNMITVELTRTDEDLPFGDTPVEGYGTTRYDEGSYYQVGFGIELLDKDGNVVTKKSATATGFGGVYSNDDVTEMASMAAGEQGSIRWTFKEEELNGVTSFRILSAYQSASGSSSDSNGDSLDSDNSSSSEVSTTSDNNWDSVIDDYEEFIDKYIALLKKAKAGDMDAVSEYASMLSKAQSLQSKLNSAQNDLTTAQAARFSKIVTKMASAATSSI